MRPGKIINVKIRFNINYLLCFFTCTSLENLPQILRCLRVLFRAKEVMLMKSYKHPCVTLALIASMPKVFESVQDKCITKANCKKDSKSFYVSIKRIT